LIEGELHVHGRLTYVITTGGEKVWPDDLEDALIDTGGLIDVAVVGIDDDEWGQRIVAFVVCSSWDDEMASMMRDSAQESLGPWAKPKEFRRVPEIPRTPNGKVRRDELVRLASDATNLST
jgi:long-chain acyl-CoA synthetase